MDLKKHYKYFAGIFDSIKFMNRYVLNPFLVKIENFHSRKNSFGRNAITSFENT